MSTDRDSSPPGSGGRQARRRARTRQALLDAAVRITASGRAEQSTIQQITDEADLGFGTFYNHFESKEELFAVASAEVLERWGRMLDAACVDLTDPAERFAAKFRISGRVGRMHPERARFLTELGLEALRRPDGLAPRARRDLAAAFAVGRLRHPSPEVALSATAGALIGLLAAQLETAGGVDDGLVDAVTAGLLRMLGMDPAEAERVASLPLPPPSEEG